jgi:predicted membrane protein
MRLVLLLVLLLGGFTGPVRAQQAPALAAGRARPANPPRTAARGAAGATRADTVAAVRVMFHSRRFEAKVLAVAGATAAALFASYAVALQQWGRAGNTYAVPTILITAVVGGVPAVVAVGKHKRFSLQQEQAVIEAYNQGGALPGHITRRLGKRHFAK